jgi:hypothetical protein
MPITPWKSLWETRFPSLREEMDKLFEDFFGKTGFPSIKDGVLKITVPKSHKVVPKEIKVEIQ